MYRLLRLAPTPESQPSELPGRHWDPSKAPAPNISAHDLKCAIAFVIILLILWGVARIANGSWRPPPNGGGSW